MESSNAEPRALPDALRMRDGRRVRSAADWKERRAELLDEFAEHVYGRPLPAPPETLRIIERVLDAQGVGGKAVVKELTVAFGASTEAPRMHVLVFLPRHAPGPVRAFLGLNFYGNVSVSDEPSVPLYDDWISPDPLHGIGDRATERSREISAAVCSVRSRPSPCRRTSAPSASGATA